MSCTENSVCTYLAIFKSLSRGLLVFLLIEYAKHYARFWIQEILGQRFRTKGTLLDALYWPNQKEAPQRGDTGVCNIADSLCFTVDKIF